MEQDMSIAEMTVQRTLNAHTRLETGSQQDSPEVSLIEAQAWTVYRAHQACPMYANSAVLRRPRHSHFERWFRGIQ